jgi:hypothetical protein
MHRPRYLWTLLLTPLLVVLVFSAAGCGGSEHDQMIKRFFQASALADNATLGNVATVSFDPAKDGKASNVSFVSETPAQIKVLKIAELDKAFKDVQAAEAEFSKKKNEFQDKNLAAINRVLKIEEGKGKAAGADAAIQAAWTKWREDAKEEAKKVSEARLALAAERKVADLSMPDADMSKGEVTQETKEVTVSATVATATGQKETKNIVLTLQRVSVKDGEKVTAGKWFITGVK